MAKAGTKEQRLSNMDALVSVELRYDSRAHETPEQIYARAASKERRAALGQFFTPEPIAQLMAQWVAVIRPNTVLDPAAGPGIFARTARQHLPTAKITCVDIDPAPLDLARKTMRADSNIQFLTGDFLTLDVGEYEGILANPPYLRHHNLNYPYDIHAEIGLRNGIKISRLANLYCLFILEICRRLKPGGRAAIIVPAEWMNANYGVALKRYFYEHKLLRTLIYFSHDTLPFDDALTTAAILLIDKSPLSHDSLEVLYVKDAVDVRDVQRLLRGEINEHPGVKREHIQWAVLNKAAKWDSLFSLGAGESPSNLIPMGALCDSRRGIATGANEFFHITRSMAKAYGIREENQKPCIGRATHVRGLVFSTGDYKALDAEDERTRLVAIQTKLAPGEQKYIEHGASLGLHTRYLLAGRAPWYAMENRAPAPIWAAVFGRARLRFIYNAAGIWNLTTFHCLYPKDLGDLEIIALVALLNSAPIQDRATRHRRVYGGGLSKFEPKDLLQLEVPDVRKLNHDQLREIADEFLDWDRAIRTKGYHGSPALNAIARKLIDSGPEPDAITVVKYPQAELF